jgi:hypothetical protein
MIKYFITSYKIYIYKGVRYDMSQIKKVMSVKQVVFLLLYKVLSVNVTVLLNLLKTKVPRSKEIRMRIMR